MGNNPSSVLELVQSGIKSVGDVIKSIKLPSISNTFGRVSNPFSSRLNKVKNSFTIPTSSNSLKNFGKGVSSGIIGPRQVTVEVNNGPFGFGRATQTRSVSNMPLTVSGVAGDFVGNKISRFGRTGTNPIIPNNNPSLVKRIKQNFKSHKKPNNIEMSNMSQQQQLEQPQPQPQQQGGNKKKPSQNEKKPSGNKKKPSQKETNPSKKEKKPSQKETNPSKKEKKPCKK